MTEKLEVGAYEAKTHLPELLRKVRAGSSFTITQRGEAVADLVPTGRQGDTLRKGAAAAGRMRQFMRRSNETVAGGVSGVDIKALIADGRD